MDSISLILVPCKADTRKACELLRQAMQQATRGYDNIAISEAAEVESADGSALLALDSSRECKASDILKQRRIKPDNTLYLPDILSTRQLPKPGVPIEQQWDELTACISEAITAEIASISENQAQQESYFDEIAAVIQRYQKEAAAVEQAGEPSEELPKPPEDQIERLELAANRFRNQFMRCDEITPPAALATTHDVFQDACMCMTYAIQHWQRSEWKKARDYLEQATHQAGPLLRNKAVKARL